MSVQITDVRMAPSSRGHAAITHYFWEDTATGKSDWLDKNSMVEWVRRNPSSAWVAGPSGSAWVVVIEPVGVKPYLRTQADGIDSDNLLALPGAR